MSNTSQNKNDEKSFWDKIARERIYAAFDDEEYLDVFNRSLGLSLKGQVIVDVGCASGVSAALLASRGAKVMGIDISPELINQAKNLWPEYKEQIVFNVGDAENFDIQDGTIDACFFGGVLHHFPDKDEVYREVFRILKPGGKLIALEPNKKDFLELIEWAIADLRGKLSPNEYPINPHEMKHELQELGFYSIRFHTLRHDIPFLAQLPLLKYFFSRKKGFWLKKPLLRLINAFREPVKRGTFFYIEAIK